MKGQRRVEVGSEEWIYRIGRGAVVVVAPDGRKSIIDFSALTGRDWNTLERGQWKKTSDGMVTPAHVRTYIEAHRPELVKSSIKIPTLRQVEKALDEKAIEWEGRCFEIASRIVKHKLVAGVAVYGHWLGPIVRGSTFDRGVPFVHHGWVLLPDKRVLDPTRWVFESRKPYLYVGIADHYDEGGTKIRDALAPAQAPKFDPDERRINFTQRILPSDAWVFVENLLGLNNTLSMHDDYEPGTVSFNQVFWLANRNPDQFKEHAPAIYRALYAVGEGCLIPMDNRLRVEREFGVSFA